MDPATLNIIIKIIDITPRSIEALIKKNALSEINSKLDTVIAKQDQQILSELKSAFDAIEDAINTSNDVTRSQRLNYAENTFLPNTRLDASLKTAGKPNNYWIALANYGLASACHLRGDEGTAVTHLLRMFEAEPRYARTALAPKLYQEFFRPRCREVLDWATKKTAEITSSKFLARVAMARLGHGTAAGLFLLLSPVNVGFLGPCYGRVKEAFKVSPEKYREAALFELNEQLEKKLDDRCKAIATSLL